MDIDKYLEQVMKETRIDEEGLVGDKNIRDLFKTAREAHAMQCLSRARGDKNLMTMGGTRADLLGSYTIVYGLDKTVDDATTRAATQLTAFESAAARIAREHLAAEKTPSR